MRVTSDWCTWWADGVVCRRVYVGAGCRGQHLRAVVGCALTCGLANSVFVVVIVVRCVAMTIMQIVHVIAMRDGFVSAIRAMC